MSRSRSSLRGGNRARAPRSASGRNPHRPSVRGRSHPPRAEKGSGRGADTAALEDAARPLLEASDVLARVGNAMQMHGYAGDLMPAQLAYVALTSRLLARPMSLAFVAEAAAGKNATVDAARALVPPGAVYVFPAGSPRALLYTKEPFEHRVVLFTDADGGRDTGSGRRPRTG